MDNTTSVSEPPVKVALNPEEQQKKARVEGARKLIEKFEEDIVYNAHLRVIHVIVGRSHYASELIKSAPLIMDVIAEHLLGLQAREQERIDFGGYNSAEDIRLAWAFILRAVGGYFFGGSNPGRDASFTQMGEWARANAW